MHPLENDAMNTRPEPQRRKPILSFRPLPLLAAALACVSAVGPGCATGGADAPGSESGSAPRARGAASRVAREALKDSSVDITYVLGHSRRKLVAWAKNESFGGRTLLEQQIVHEAELDRARYSELFGKVEEFVASAGSAPAPSADSRPRKPASNAAVSASNAAAVEAACRTPFTVTVRIGSDSKVLQGCRGTDAGSLSRLVREGEFLLHSRQ